MLSAVKREPRIHQLKLLGSQLSLSLRDFSHLLPRAGAKERNVEWWGS